MMRRPIRSSDRESGAALVIGLLLLVVLTLLAISGMNTASLEFIMARNEQVKQESFHAAESGIDAKIEDLSLYTAYVPLTVTSSDNDLAIPGSSATYDYSVQYIDQGGAPSGYSTSEYAGYHFKVTSTGKAGSSAEMTVEQGIERVGKSASDPTCKINCSTSTELDMPSP